LVLGFRRVLCQQKDLRLYHVTPPFATDLIHI
jgi:hypothetical protein